MSKFNFNIDIESNDQVLMGKSVYQTKSQLKAYADSMYVDLELPSGTIWGIYNIGVNIEKVIKGKKVNLFGDYYAWGETELKDVYNWKTYKYGNLTLDTAYAKYEVNNSHKDKTMLEYEDDAAYMFTNGKCKIPTSKQFEELTNETEQKWITGYNGTKYNGVLFIGKNGNELFFPAAGGYDEKDLVDKNKECCYWTSNVSSKHCMYARAMRILRGVEVHIDLYKELRKYGLTIKPVKI